MFSSRVPSCLTPSALAEALAQASICHDLTATNPTQVGFDYPVAEIRAALSAPAVCTYQPEAVGPLVTRLALVESANVRVPPERVFVTASTSESYAWLLKLLCDPGDAVAIAAPTYPLVEHLAELEGVRVQRYLCRYDGQWYVDMESVSGCLRAGARAIVVVHPNNPTGHVLLPEQWERLRLMCAAHGAALLVDEVFLPFGFGGAQLASVTQMPGTLNDGPLTFVLDGLSKRAGLPQVKLGWLSVGGAEGLVREACRRMSWIADAYLSVSASAALGAPALLKLAPGLHAQIRARVAHNGSVLRTCFAATAVDVLAADGGWYGVLRVANVMPEDVLVRRLALAYGVLVHPGFFYDFPTAGYLVVSLLPPSNLFAQAARCLRGALDALLTAGC